MLLKPQAFFAHVRKHLFGGTLNQGQVDGINATPHAWDLGDGSLNRLAYVLATPNGTMQPMTEYGSRAYFNKSSRALRSASGWGTLWQATATGIAAVVR